MRLTLTPNPANLPPDAVSASATTTGANLTWTTNPYALTADSYKVEYGMRGFTPGTGTLVSPAPTTEACSLTGLTAGTWYDVYVSSVKGGATSAARKATFHTETVPMDLPYSLTYVEGQMTSYIQSSYSVEGEIPLGWSFPGIAADKPQVWYNGSAVSSAIFLRTNNSAPAVAVLPELDADLNKVVIGFTASLSGTLEYGYWNGGVFTALGTATSGANSVDLEDLGTIIPAGSRLAFRMTRADATIASCNVSAITVDQAPTCKVPTGLAVDEATRSVTGFTMRWGGVQNEGDKYHVVLKRSGVTVSDVANITDRYYAFTGLDSARGYEFYVSKVCGGSVETDQAHYVGTLTTHWAVRTAVNDPAMGSVTGNASGPFGSNTTLTAVPNEGYEFVNWTVKDANGSEQTPLGTAAIDLTLNNSNRLWTYKANFQVKHYTLTVAADPAEAVVATAGGNTYNYGVSVNGSAIYVTPAAGYDFIGWSDGVAGDVNGSNIRHAAANVAMTDDVTLTAYFAASGASTKTIIATVNDADGGSISSATGTGNAVTAGTSISVTYAINPGFTFDGWTVNGASAGTAATWTGTADANKVIVANFSRSTYSVTIASNDDEVGTVAGATSGVKAYGTELTLVPNPANAKAHFREWQDELGNVIGNAVPLNVTVTSAATYKAIFYVDSVNVSVVFNEENRGTVHIENTVGTTLSNPVNVADGKSVVLVAVPNAHYHFDGWKIGSQNYSNSTSYTYTAAGTDAKTFTAHFSIDQHSLNVTSMNENVLSVTDTINGNRAYNGNYNYGSEVKLTAKYNADECTFTGWYNGATLISAANPYTFYLTENTTLEARYTINQYTIAVAKSAGQSTWGEVSCTPAAGSHDYGTVFTITATPATGYDFVKWNEDNNTNASRSVRLEGDATYTAVFARHEYNVNITSSNPSWGGVTLSPAAGPYYYGDVVVATAAETNTDDYKFIGWSDNQQNNVKARSFTVNGDINVTAIFANADQWSVFVQSNNNAVGTATAKVGGLDVTSVNNNTVVNIAATVTDEHYQFAGWSNGVNDAATTVTVTKDTIITANFSPKSYLMTLTAGEGGSITGASTGMKVYGTTVTFRAEADEANHYHFVQWAEDGSTVAERTVTVDGAATYTAVFALDAYAVTATVDNGGTATLTPSAATYNHNTSLTIAAAPAANYHVTGWLKNGADYVPTTDAQHTTITVTEAAAFRVLTAKDQYTLNITSENNSKGYITGDANGLYDFDESVSVTAVPADNYDFANWDNNPALDNPTLALDMDENQTHVAYFQLKSYSVQVAAAANGQLKYSVNNGAETTGNINNTYNHGTQIVLQALPTTAGYEFDKWSDEVTTNPRSLYVSGAVNLTAAFTLAEYDLTLTVNDGTMGSVDITAGEKATYNYGDVVTIAATVSNTNLYKFLSWSDGNTNATRDITMTGDVEYKALFGQLDMLTVSVLSNNNEWGTAEASATSVNLNDNVNITATPAANYHLVGWSDMPGNTNVSRTGVHITKDTIITAIFAIDTHTVALTTGSYGNTVTGAGEYAHGSSATLYAEAAAHCHFTGWSGDITSASNPVNVVVNGDQNITANFARDEVHIQASAVNGTVNFADSVIFYDSICQLTATPAAHYSHFKGWTRNGVAIAGTETITVDAQSDGIYQATFAIDTVQLTVAVNNTAMGSVNGPVSGQYTYGTPVSLTAVPAAHYHFEGWTGSNTSSSEAISFVLEGDSTLTANFAINEHNLTIAVDPSSTGMGTVNDAVNGSYAYGTSIDIEATPIAGMSFTEWSDGPTVASRTITMGESDIDITAVFDTIYYNVNVVTNDPTMATILGAQSQYVWDDVVTFTAHNLDTNLYKFIGWSDGLHGLDTVRVETIQGDLNLTAIFTDKEKLSVYVQSNNQAWGTATASSNAVNINHSVTLTAAPTANHHFVAWMNGVDVVSTDATYMFDVTENVNYTAIFRTDTHTVTLTNVDGHAASMSGEGDNYDWNSPVTVSVVAAEYYDFVGWVDDNSVLVSTENPFTFNMGAADTTLDATFTEHIYTITVNAQNGGSIVKGDGNYAYNSQDTLVAEANTHFTFGGWQLNGVPVPATNGDSLIFTVSGNATYTATFIEDAQYTVSLMSENLAMGTVAGAETLHEGDNFHIVATPKTHYHFVNWYDAADTSVVFGTAADTTFAASADLNLVARFAIDNFTLTVATDGNGDILNAGVYDYGTWVTLEAVPNEHYHIYKWHTDAGDSLANTPTINIRVVSDTNINATFERNTYNIVVNAEHGHSATGAGAYLAESTATISAQADDNYHFYTWTKNGLDIPASTETMEVTVTGNDTYTAVYSENDAYRVYVQSANLATGTVTGNAAYHVDNIATVTATPAAHYHFLKWTDNNGNFISSDATYDFAVVSDTTLTAYFEIDTHAVTFKDAENGTMTGAGYYDWNSQVTVTATAAEHYHFMAWTDTLGNEVSTVNPYSFNITKDTALTATFAIDTHTVTRVEVNGTIETVKLHYTYGESATFTAVADPDYHFVSWSNGELDTTVTVTIYGDTTVEAIFAIDSHLVSFEDVANVTLSDSGWYHIGETVTVNAEPAEHYDFVKWTLAGDDAALATTEAYSFTMPNSDVELSAVVELTTYNLTFGAENGSTDITAQSYTALDSVIVVAEAQDSNYTFSHWTKNGVYYGDATNETLATIATGNDNYTAVYTENDVYTVRVYSANMATGSVLGDSTYHVDNNAVVVATPAEHYHFLYWKDRNGDTASTDAEYNFVISQSEIFTAYFEIDTHEVTFKDAENGTMTGAGYYDWNSQVTVTATAAEHYHFMAWTDTLGNEVSTVNPYSFNITEDTALTARFDIDTHDVTLVEVNGTIETAKLRYTYGESATFKAVAAADYHFISWSNGELDTTVTVTIYGDTTVEAIFAIDSHYVSFEDVENVTLSDSGWYHIGETVTVNAEPAEHYDFVKWTLAGDDVALATTEAYSFTMPNSDIELSAVVELTTYNLTFGGENGSTDLADTNITALESVTVVASAQDTNHTFSHWTKNGVYYGDATTDTLTVIATGNDNYTAVYTENDVYTVRVYSANMATGSVLGDSTYHVDNNAVVVATPAEHYHFLYWKDRDGAIASYDAEYNFVITGNEILTAYFEIDTHYTAVHSYYSGYDIFVEENDSIYFNHGLNIQYTAAMNNSELHHHFMYWVNDAQEIVSYDNPVIINLTSDSALTAWYDIDTFDVVLEAENGTIETDTLRYIYDAEATFTAVAAERYHFAGWSNGELDNPITVNIHNDTTVSAIFEKDLQHLTIIDDMNGEVWEYDFPWGVNLNLGHAEYEHYHFKGFYDEDGNLIGMNNPTVYYFDTTITIHATYAIDTHTVTLVANNGTIVTDTLRYIYGDSAMFVAVPDENYNFGSWVMWVGNSFAFNTESDTLRIVIEGDLTLEAIFNIDSYSFTVASNSMSRGYVTGSQNGNYNRGTALQVVANANENYDFVGWFNANDMTDTIATTDTLNIVMTADTNIVAVFTDHLFTVDAIVNDTAMGSVTGTGLFVYHGLTTVTAVPAEGHHFVMWADSVTTESRLVYVEGDTTFEAIFAVDTHYVTVTVNDTLMGSATGEGWYNWGDTVTIRAYVNEHFNFVGFNGRTDRIDSITYVVREDTTFTAYFDYQYMRIYSQFENGSVNINVAGVDANTATMPVIAHYGDSITMTATADTHYHFVEWVEYSISYDTVLYDSVVYETVETAGIDSATGEPILVIDTISSDTLHLSHINTIRTADTTYSDTTIAFRIYETRYIDAVFAVDEVTLQLMGMHVTMTGNGTYNAGDTVTVTATPNEHYVFLGWSDGILTGDTVEYNIVDSNATYTFVIWDDMTLWAITEGEVLTVTLLTDDTTRGVLVGTGSYHYGDVVTISATANEGFTFVGWSDGDTHSVRTFTLAQDVTLVAHFHKVGIDDVQTNNVTIYANGDVIYVKGAERQTVRVFDAVGRMVSSTVANSETLQMTMNASGVYMVQVGNARARRVMVVR